MPSKNGVGAIVPAAGRGKRLGGKIPKAFVRIAGAPLFIHTLRALLRAYPFSEAILVTDASYLARARKLLRDYRLKKVRAVAGGATRAASVKNGLLALSPSVRTAAVHDAARPMVPASVVRRTVAAGRKNGGAICALPVSSTVKRLFGRRPIVRGTENRDELVLAQTPQVFDKAMLLARYRTLGARAMGATDEAALFDGTRVRVRVVEGAERNFKITTKKDLELFKHFVGNGHARSLRD